MKKFIIMILVMVLVFSLSATTAFAAKGENSSNAGSGKNETRIGQSEGNSGETKEKNEARNEEFAAAKSDFQQRKLERAELRNQSKEDREQLRLQVREQKRLLYGFLEQMGGMPEGDDVEMPEEIALIIEQIKDAQQYKLEIIASAKNGIKKIASGVRIGQLPLDGEVVEEIIDGVLSDLNNPEE
jgi:hypothetical protein